MTHPAPPSTSPRTVDHFPRHPWAQGERWYTVHATFDEHDALHAHAQRWRRVLAPFSQLDPVPDQWLHLTMQGVGRLGVIDQSDLEAVSDAAAQRLSSLSAFDLTIGAPVFTDEATRFEPTPVEPLAAARSAVRDAIAEVLLSVPEPAAGFVPHITVGYGNRDEDASQIVRAIADADIPPITITITHIDLILLSRDEGMYTWNLVRPMPLTD